MKISELVQPTERQRQCFEAIRKFRFVLYGGAMGGGKSYLLRWWCVIQCIYYFAKYDARNVRVGLFSEDYPTLVDRQISKIKFEFPNWLGVISKSHTEGFNFKLADRFGGGVIAFRNLDDPSKYNSAEFASIAVEELTKNKESVFHELRKRLRWRGIPNEDTRFLAATNPGGPGHAWVKRFWLDRDFPPEMAPLAEQFCYIQSKAQDNPHLTEEYYRDLLTLPGEMAKAYAEGDWDLFQGQYFKTWRKDVHVVEPHPIPWFWKVRRVGDWGEAKPCAYAWIATSPEGQHVQIAEIYKAGLSVRDQALRIHEIEDGLRAVGVEIEPIGILDSACWDGTGRPKSIAAQFEELKLQWVKSSKGPGSRVQKWQEIRKQLEFERDANGNVTRRPNFTVFATCKETIRTIPSLVHDDTKPEDLDTNGEDHMADAWGNFFAEQNPPPKTPESQMGDDEVARLRYAMKRFQEQQN